MVREPASGVGRFALGGEEGGGERQQGVAASSASPSPPPWSQGWAVSAAELESSNFRWGFILSLEKEQVKVKL